MHLEEFSEGSTFIHRIDPRVKLLTLPPVIIWLAVTLHWSVPVFGLMLAIIATIFARLNFRELIHRMIPVNLFLLFLWMVLPFSIPGEEIFRFAGMSYSLPGFYQAALITIKANAIVLLTISVLGTVPIFKLTHALRHLRVPDKLVHLFFFCYRYLTVLHRDYTNIVNAVKARGFHPGTNTHTYKTYANMIGMLIVRSFDHSEKIYQAMICRGFQGKFPLFHHFRFQSKDLIYLSVSFFILLVLAWLEFYVGV